MDRNRPFLLLVLALLVLASCTTAQNYEDPNGPLFSGDYATDAPPYDGTLKVVSYNVRFASDIASAIAELQDLDSLKDVDILLLQEMDDAGTDAVARALAYNYVYYPATLHPRNRKNFGNAILSPWPISDPSKLLLPHRNLLTRQVRTATRATVAVADLPVLTYSVHTETLTASPGVRKDQIDALIADIDPDARYVVLGGDFNTATDGEIEDLEARFAEVDIFRVSEGSGPTVGFGPSRFTLDHIFARGMEALESGVVEQATASDHWPVWAWLAPS